MNNPLDIQIWAQMFFDDGSVSMGVRVAADSYDDDREIMRIANSLLMSTNRQEGYLLLWGAGQIGFHRYRVTSALKELKTLASESSLT